ncbi:MAG: hypothetical protein ACI85O_003173 [Saprospiraceae bacterium]|jgi:hypothetical protein
MVLNQNEPDRAIKLYQVRGFFSKKPKSEVLLDFNGKYRGRVAYFKKEGGLLLKSG